MNEDAISLENYYLCSDKPTDFHLYRCYAILYSVQSKEQSFQKLCHPYCIRI